MSIKEKYWRYSLIVIILVLGVVIFKQIIPFLGGLLGAMTIYTLVRGQMKYLSKRMKRYMASILITIESVLFFLVPIALIVWLVVSQIQYLNLDPKSIIAPVEQLAAVIKAKTGYDVLGTDTLSFLVSMIPRIGQAIMSGIGNLTINLFVMIFVLYFMLIGGEKMENYIKDLLPFNDSDTTEVTHQINMIVRSNAIGIPLLAIIQGFVALVGYIIFGVPNAWLMGLLTCFSTVIPMVGTAIVWVPVAAYLGFTGSWPHAIGIALYGGIVISQCDNFIRFILQKKMADTHPLITIFGVVIGLPLFGFMGVIFGPLLLALFLLFIDMFKKQYLDGRK